MKHLYLAFLAFCTAGFIHAQTYKYVVEEWNFTGGSTNSEAGLSATQWFNSVSSDDGSDDQMLVARGNGFSNLITFPSTISSGKVHIYVTLTDWDFSNSENQDFVINLRQGSSSVGTLRFDAQTGENRMVLTGTGNAGVVANGYSSDTGITYGITFDFSGGTSGTGSYTYWLNNPEDDGSTWVNRFGTHTGDEDLSSTTFEGIRWGIQNHSGGDYFNLDRILVIHETTTPPATVDFALATEDDHVVVSSDLTTDADARFYSLTIDQGATLTVDNFDELSVIGDLIINGALVLRSSGALKTYGNITIGASGSFEVRRTTTFGNDEGRYSIVGSPISDATTDVLGGITYAYDESIAYATGNQERFLLISSPTPMLPGDGFFSADLGTAFFTGTPNTGEINVDLVYDEVNDGTTNAGWNCVSNPFSAPIELKSFLAFNPDVEGAIYLWDDGNSLAGQRSNADYITVNASGTATGGSSRSADFDGYIRGEQGFFVKANTAGTLLFNDVMKAGKNNNSGAGYFRETGTQKQLIRIGLSNESSYSETVLEINDRATEDQDRLFDALRINSGNELSIYSFNEGDDEALAIQGLPIEALADDTWLGLDISEAGSYTLDFENGVNDVNLYLTDHQTGNVVSLNEVSSYSFYSEGNLTASKRLSISSSSVVLALEPTQESGYTGFFSGDTFKLVSQNALEDANVSIHDMQGRLLLAESGINAANGEWSTTLSTNPGIYIVRVNNQGTINSFKTLK